jgi:hypothetical protein
LDYSGRLVRDESFRVGYEDFVCLATLDESRYGFLCLVLETANLSDCRTRQFYRVTEKYVEVLRSENLDGTSAMRNMAWYKVDREPPDWSDWQRLLESPEPLQQLRGLTALFSDRDRATRIDDKARHRLSELASSPDAWISEEAKLALEEAKRK